MRLVTDSTGVEGIRPLRDRADDSGPGFKEDLGGQEHAASAVAGAEQGEAAEQDVGRVEQVYRKLDRRILPALWVLYFLCTAIRSNIGLAQTMNGDVHHDLMSVLGLTSKDTSTALSLFYVSYVVFELPSNLVMSRLSPRAWLARIVIAVGVVGTCFTAVRARWSLDLLRFLLGLVEAGMWPGMAYYLTLFYPPSRMAKRIGIYFTAAQVSAAVVGLASAGFQRMDGLGGLVGFQWMFFLYGLVTFLVGISLLWWLPDRPLGPLEMRRQMHWLRWLPKSAEALKGEDAVVHYDDLRRVYHPQPWTIQDLGRVLIDWRLWPLVLMYVGVVGVGTAIQLYGNVILAAINPDFTGIQISLLFAPIWMMDLIAILIVTPFSDRFHRHRALFFSAFVCIQLAGLLTVSFALQAKWGRYAGLLLVGFGLGPTVPICMTWTSEIFQRRHGEVGVVAATALVSGLGNLGSVLTLYALYAGWPADAVRQYRGSNLTMIGILCLSIASSIVLTILLAFLGKRPAGKSVSRGSSIQDFADGAARREAHERGFSRLGWNKSPS